MRMPARLARVAAVMVVMLLARSTPARADDGECKSKQCPAGSAHAFEQISCDTPTCYCYDSCGSGGSTSTSSGGAGANAAGGNLALGIAQGVVVIAKGIAFFVSFAVMPTLLIENMMDSKSVAASKAAARKQWKRHRDAIKRIAARGRSSRDRDGKLRAEELYTISREEQPMKAVPAAFAWNLAQQVPQAPQAQPQPQPQPQPNVRPRLVPMVRFQCSGAAQTGSSIAGFADDAAMKEACQQFYGKPRHPIGPGPNSADCGITDNSGKQIYCDRTHPIYNPVSDECFTDTNFHNSERGGFGARSSIDCGVN